MSCVHEEFVIECFEAGRNLWHARIKRANRQPIILHGVVFPHLEVGFAWPDRQSAIDDARSQIDRFGSRWDLAAPPSSAPHLATTA